MEEQSMAALLEQEAAAYPELRRGEIIEGVVVGTDRDGILVDIGAKSEGVVPPHEMHCLQPEGSSQLHNGDKVLVFVVQPESPEGQIILSLDRARGERGWRVLQEYMDQNQGFDAHVTGSNKGGLLVNVEGVNAFVPLSQIVAGPERGSPEATQKALTEWVGKSINLKVIELNRRRNRAILSERAAVQEKRAAEKERLLQELNEGDLREGRITSIRDFGIFVDVGGADGLVHLSELSWERTPKSPNELFKVGDQIEVYVLKVDKESKKIALSVRRAQPERWEEIVSRYREGQIVPGQVTKLAPFGAFVRLEGPIEGLIHISELIDRRINHPKEVVDEGEVVPVKIVRIEYDRHRLGLSLRQARDRAEEDNWVFSSDGRVESAPQSALDCLGITAPPERTVEAEADVDGVSETAEATGTVEATPEAGMISAGPAAAAAPEVPVEAPAEETVLAEEAPAEAVPGAVADEPSALVAAEPRAAEPEAPVDAESVEAVSGAAVDEQAGAIAPEAESPVEAASGEATAASPVEEDAATDGAESIAEEAPAEVQALEDEDAELEILPTVNEPSDEPAVTEEPSDALNKSDES